MSTTAQLWHRRAGEPLFSRRFLRRTVTISTLLFAGIIGLSVPLLDVHASSTLSRPDSASACNISAGWFTVTTGRSVDRLELFGNLVRKNSVVLLGESHASVDHHRWQLYTLAALHGRAEKIVIGFEAFPRRLQPVLENWVAGKLSAEAFLKESEWRRVWGFDPALYMPLFQFARLNRIPMIALNVERKLVSRVGKHGWASVPILER